METVSKLTDVRTFETRAGNTRFVLRDSDGNEYTTFREEIGKRAQRLDGATVRITYHEEQRGQYENVYVDDVQPAESDAGGDGETDAEEAAWRTAVAAAPWLVGEPGDEVPPEKLYEKLKPFEERVAEDIERGGRPSSDPE